jgi:hypothetical protein
MISPLLSFLPSYFQHDPLGLFLAVSAVALMASFIVIFLASKILP